MISILLLAIGALFFWFLFKAYSSQKIRARGWGTEVRTYHRDTQPMGYWLSFAIYLACAVWATGYGVMVAFK